MKVTLVKCLKNTQAAVRQIMRRHLLMAESLLCPFAGTPAEVIIDASEGFIQRECDPAPIQAEARLHTQKIREKHADHPAGADGYRHRKNDIACAPQGIFLNVVKTAEQFHKDIQKKQYRSGFDDLRVAGKKGQQRTPEEEQEQRERDI